MKILLSAYACEPNKGSEPGVGWNWAIELSKLGYETWVLTRTNNRENIEKEINKHSNLKNINFIFYDLPAWAKWWKKGGRGVRFYYFLWQIGAFFYVKKTHKLEQFDKVHHVTFVSVRQPSFMGNLGIPFIFGPVSGGERAPWRLRFGYSFRGWILDAIRDLLNLFVKIDPFMWMTFYQAEIIYVTSEQTKSLLPKIFHKKTRIQLAIASEKIEKEKTLKINTTNKFNILYVGNFLYLKGMHLGLAAFAEVLKRIPEAKLTLIGNGPEKQLWMNLAKKLGVFNHITWIEWMEQSKLVEFYESHNVFLFPSLHDSGGLVVLEAMANALPVVCLNIGGPGIIVNEYCGIKVDVAERTERVVADALSIALINILQKKVECNCLVDGALKRAGDMGWEAHVKNIYHVLDDNNC